MLSPPEEEVRDLSTIVSHVVSFKCRNQWWFSERCTFPEKRETGEEYPQPGLKADLHILPQPERSA